MADVQRIVDEVRFRLQSGNCEPNDELKRLAGEYAGLCHAVNTRLRRCGDFLKQGLRAEAIQLADADPNLLDLYATIDFAERAEWDQVAANFQLPPAEPLLADVAQDLNEAYSLQQPLEKLLDRHRLLALCRAPLVQRLAVVRKLADADPGSRFWEEDLREFEVARCKEIEGEAHAAAAGEDEAALNTLMNEVSSSGWRQPPPAAVVQSVRKMAQQVVASQLQAAYVSRNLDRARALRDQWQALTPRSAAGNGAAGTVAPALKWLAAEDSKSQALQSQYAKIEALDRLLAANDATLAELEQARKQLLKGGRDIPADLSVRLDARVRTLRDEAKSSRRRTAIIVAAGTCVAIGVFSFMIWSSLRHSEATRIANSAEQLVAQGNLRQARQLLESNAWMSRTEQYLAAQGKLVEAEKKDEIRAGNFKAAIERAQSATTAQQAEPALAEADRLAVTSDEMRLVEDVKARLGRMSQEAARDDDNRFQQQLAEVNDLLDRLEELQEKAATGAAFTDLVKIAEAKCRELRQMAPKVKPALVTHVDAAEARLARIRKTVANADRRHELLEKLNTESAAMAESTDPAAQVRQYGQTLQDFSAAFPGDAKAANFAEAAKELDLWRGIVEWQQLAGRWKALPPKSAKEARSRAAECNAWLGEFAACPAAPMMRDYLAFLSSVVSRDEDSSGDQKEGLREKLQGLFSGLLMEDVEMFVTANGDRFYVRERYEWAEGKPIKYIAGVRGEQKSLSLKQAEVNMHESREAPQSILRRKVRDIMTRASSANWDEALLTVAELVRNDHDLDPFLRYRFLLRVLELASEGDSILGTELEPVITELRGASVKVSAKLMDPKDTEANAARKNAQRALASFKPLKDTFDRAAERMQDFGRRMFERATPVGWLSVDSQGRWECLSAADAKSKPGTTLWMVQPAVDEPVASWVKVGDRAGSGMLTVTPEAKPHLVQGRLLFTRTGLGPAKVGNGK